MKNINFDEKKKVYFIGIGGISMLALALILKDQGFDVSGSDSAKTDMVLSLIDKNIDVHIGHDKNNITSDIDLIVYTSAIHDDNVELSRARDLGITCIPRSKLLGDIMLNYNKVYNVAGTHGKTTITSIISKCLVDFKYNPTVTVGGMLKDIGGNFYIGKNDIFVAEACEYTNSFLDFHPNVEVISNIEEDHLDFFKDINDIRESFKKFIDLMDKDGLLIINKNIENIDELVSDYKGKIKTYSIDGDSNYVAKNIIVNDDNTQNYDLYIDNRFVDTIKLKINGRHNVENSLAALAALLENKVEISHIKDTLADFSGCGRRLENKGVYSGITFIDDYAHHPSEIRASIEALKSLKCNNLYIVYQPHTYSRTKLLFNDFIEELAKAPKLILANIYAARENNIYNISSNDIIEIINSKYSKDALYLPTFQDIEKYIIENAKEGDIVVTMGAGDIFKVSDSLIKHYKNV